MLECSVRGGQLNCSPLGKERRPLKKRERMKAILRASAVFVAAALAAAPASSLAQTAPVQTPTPTPTPTPSPAPTSNSTSPVAIGPSELQNFNLKGTVTRQADQPPVATPARPQTAPVRPPSLGSSATRPPQSRNAERATAPSASRSTTTTEQSVSSNITPPPVESQPAPALQQPLTPISRPVSAPAEASNPFSQISLWPWIAATLALAAAVGFLLWRRSQREPIYEGGQYDLLVPAAPEPEPAPAPAPAPVQRAPAPALARAPEPKSEDAPTPAFAWRPSSTPSGTVTTRLKPARPSGIVASSLRPALELAFHPLSCLVDDDEVAIEFELELFNAGTAPARAIFAEASLLNASATQDAELAAFFQNAHGKGEPVDVIPPMKRMSFRSRVVAPRAAVHEYELAGRKTFVPVIAFNALYEWSGGKAQSSAAYIVGRDTQQDKLGPLRLDQGAREFSGLGARPLPSGVRT
jgi:hypothetical protein